MQKVPEALRLGLLAFAQGVMMSRPSDFVIGEEGNVYMERWHDVPKSDGPNIYWPAKPDRTIKNYLRLRLLLMEILLPAV